MNTYLVSKNLSVALTLTEAHAINAHDAEGAAEKFAALFLARLDASVCVLAVRDVRDRLAGRVTVEITPTRNGPPEIVAIGSRYPVEVAPDLPTRKRVAIGVGTASAAV